MIWTVLDEAFEAQFWHWNWHANFAMCLKEWKCNAWKMLALWLFVLGQYTISAHVQFFKFDFLLMSILHSVAPLSHISANVIALAQQHLHQSGLESSVTKCECKTLAPLRKNLNLLTSEFLNQQLQFLNSKILHVKKWIGLIQLIAISTFLVHWNSFLGEKWNFCTHIESIVKCDQWSKTVQIWLCKSFWVFHAKYCVGHATLALRVSHFYCILCLARGLR